MRADTFTIRTRLILAFGLILIILMLLATTSLYGTGIIGHDLNEIYQSRLVPLSQMARINDLMRRSIQHLTIATISRGSPEDIQTYLNRTRNNMKEIDNLTHIFFEGTMTDEERSLAEEWVKNKDIFVEKGLQPTMTDLTNGAFTDAQDTITGIGGQLYKKTQNVMDDLMATQLETAERINADAQEHVSVVHTITVGAIVVVFFFCAIVFFIIRSIIRPITSLVNDVNILAHGEVSQSINGLSRRDEVGLLAGALENWRLSMIETQKARDEARERARQMEILSASIRTMLDALGQGILSFEADGICSNVFSKACVAFLEASPANRPVTEVLGLPQANKIKFDAILKLLFDRKKTMATPPQELLDMLPQKFHHSKGASIHLQYRPILDSAHQLHSVLVVATDRTEQETALRISQERETYVLMVLRILADQNDFKHFYQNITTFFADPNITFAHDVSIDQLKRDIHTFKGSALLYYLQDLANALHELESILGKASEIHSVSSSLNTALPSLQAAILSAKESAIKILGDDFDKQGMTRVVPLHLLKSFACELKGIRDADDFYKRFIRLFIGQPIHELLSDLDIVLQELANRYGKSIAFGPLKGENFSILTEVYRPLFATFSHIFRNIIDHAIDDTETRHRYGKPSICTVTFETLTFERKGQKWFSLSFADDGRGIDIPRLRSKLQYRKAEISDASDQDILEYIFEEGVSTKDSVTELSGRGIGMSAVKYEAERLGGSVRVESALHLFTKITFEVPFIWD